MKHLEARGTQSSEDLTSRAYCTLKEAIVNLELRAGQPLVEARLAEQLGTSRTPVREAIRVLVAEGLAIKDRNRRSYVAEMNIEDVEVSLQIVGLLEGLATRIATERISAQYAKELSGIGDGLRKVLESKDSEEMIRLDCELHFLLQHIASSEKLSHLIAIARGPLERFRRVAQRDPILLPAIAVGHAALVDAVLAGHPTGAESLCRSLFEDDAKRLTELLNRLVVPIRNRF